MIDNYVYLKCVDVIDEQFTEAIRDKWELYMLKAYKVVYRRILKKIDSISPIQFFFNKSLAREVFVDAVIGLKKITGSPVHSVSFPNPFKIAAYLAYWWLRHKPVSIHYPLNYSLEKVILSEKIGKNLDDKTKEHKRQELIWELKHINELVAVVIAMCYIFCFNEAVCGDKECMKVKNSNKDCFPFNNFKEMKTTILRKLTYYFSYRPIAPKVIEHILEAYAFHPAWRLTGTPVAQEESCNHGK